MSEVDKEYKDNQIITHVSRNLILTSFVSSLEVYELIFKNLDNKKQNKRPFLVHLLTVHSTAVAAKTFRNLTSLLSIDTKYLVKKLNWIKTVKAILAELAQKGVLLSFFLEYHLMLHVFVKLLV